MLIAIYFYVFFFPRWKIPNIHLPIFTYDHTYTERVKLAIVYFPVVGYTRDHSLAVHIQISLDHGLKMSQRGAKHHRHGVTRFECGFRHAGGGAWKTTRKTGPPDFQTESRYFWIWTQSIIRIIGGMPIDIIYGTGRGSMRNPSSPPLPSPFNEIIDLFTLALLTCD